MSRFEWERWNDDSHSAEELAAAGGAPTPPKAHNSEEPSCSELETSKFQEFEIRCDDYGSLLTALFDGEATGEEERIAQLHLERCPHCAQMWHDWEKSQLIWRAMPAAAIPPGLLLRILTACRVASLSAKFSRQTRDMRRTLAQRVPPLAGLFPEVAPPPELKDEILRRTVYAAAEQAEHSNRAPWSLWTQRAARWGVAVAVPASVAWMMLISQPQTVLQDSFVTQETAISTQRSALARVGAPAGSTKSRPEHAQKLPLGNRLAALKIRAPKAIVNHTTVVNDVDEKEPQEHETSKPAFSADDRVVVSDSVPEPKPERASTHVALPSFASTSRTTERSLSPVVPAVHFAALKTTAAQSEMQLAPLPKATESVKVRTASTPRFSPVRRATSRVKIERAAVRSSSTRSTARVRASLVERPVLRAERRTPGPSVSSPEVVLAALPVRMAAADPRPVGPANVPASSEELGFDEDETVRLANSEPEQLHNILSEYQASLLSDDDMTG